MGLVLASRGPNWGWEQSPTSGRRLQDQRACGMKDGGIHRKPPLLWRVLERSDHVPACPRQSGFLPAAGIITSSVPFLSKGVQAWMLHCMSPDGGDIFKHYELENPKSETPNYRILLSIF